MATMFGRFSRRKCLARIRVRRCFLLVVLLAIFFVGGRSAEAAVAWVSASHAVCTQSSSGTSSQTCTLPAATTAGDDIVVGIAWQNTGASVSHVYGSGTTSYFPLYATVCGSGECAATVVCHRCTAQSAVTTTMSEGTAFVTTVEEYSGVAALGITGVNNASSTAPGLTMTTGDANDFAVCTTASTGSGVPGAGSGNLRSAASTGSIAGATVDNTAASPGSVACTATIASGAWAAAGIELRSVAPRTYIWPDCDTTHPCVVHHVDTVAVATAQDETLNGFKFVTVPSSAGNLLVFTVTHMSNKTVTISDNNSGSWQTAVTTTNNGDGVETEVHYLCGAAAGTNTITVQLSSASTSGQTLQYSYNEVSGIAPSSCLDTASGANGLTHDLQPGALGTTADGDLIYNFAEESYNYPEYENPISWIMPDDNSALLMENIWDKFASQVSVQAAHGSYNPTLYVNTDPNNRDWNSVAAAFKASSGAGTQPTGIHVTRVMHYYNPPLPVTPAYLPFPVTGNAVAITSAYPSGSYAGNMTDVADTQGDAWTRTPYTSYAYDPQIYYACLGAQTAGRDLTIDWLPDTGTTHMIVYDVAGAQTTGGTSGCVGTTVNDIMGNQASTANAPMLNTPVVTPESSNSVILAVNQTGIGPPSGTLTPGVVFVSVWATGMTDSTNWDSGDCYGYIYTSSTSPIDFSWSMANSITDPNGGSGYVGAAIEIVPAGSNTAPPPPNATYSLTATAVSVAPGGSAHSTITVSSSDGYAGTVTLTCAVTSEPAGATDLPTCSASQTVTLSAGTESGTATVTLNTTAPSNSHLTWPQRWKRWGEGGGGALLALLVFLGIPARRRWPPTFLCVAGLSMVVVLGSLAGCGSKAGGGSTTVSNSGTTPGTYTITVTGTGSDSAQTTATTTFTLTVN